MPSIDMPLEELERYRPDVAEPDDFAELWSTTLAEARALPLDLVVTPVATDLRLIDVHDVEFAGFAGDRIKAWYLRPAGVTGPLPVIVEYNGYGGGRGLPHERLGFVAAGYAYLFMDTRGQGSTWGSGGSTPDPHGSGPALPGFMTRGVLDIRGYYYRRLFTDAVRAVDAARSLDGVDPDRVVVTGGSQGGGITLAVAGLVDGLAGVMADVPFLAHVQRGVEVALTDPYAEIVRYLAVHRDHAEQVFRTLSYVDGVNHARRASAPALFSVALLDATCPPSTVYAAYRAYAGPKEIAVYRFNDHEGGQAYQLARQLTWLRTTLGH
ncbi:acetylxylan esterase [Cellulomonas soli]|uniref:Acetylxylan esterase n=1 Tax=Cellulomonas soli TaxID=931535 RepID=A0A512P8W7_9CELL|nr:acetylxylan esterase [Cellulomonas soli]NYI57846.1 cephalosporin-C deacetylase [Cellulomonas soli]GEP67630.1 acetylxylan esterase [Cellulomonas soli]